MLKASIELIRNDKPGGGGVPHVTDDHFKTGFAADLACVVAKNFDIEHWPGRPARLRLGRGGRHWSRCDGGRRLRAAGDW